MIILDILGYILLIYFLVQVIWNGCVFKIGDGIFRFELYPLKRFFKKSREEIEDD